LFSAGSTPTNAAGPRPRYATERLEFFADAEITVARVSRYRSHPWRDTLTAARPYRCESHRREALAGWLHTCDRWSQLIRKG